MACVFEGTVWHEGAYGLPSACRLFASPGPPLRVLCMDRKWTPALTSWIGPLNQCKGLHHRALC
jgi:hypothetical protein